MDDLKQRSFLVRSFVSIVRNVFEKVEAIN